MIVGAAFGSNLANAVSLKNDSAVLVVSYLMLSLGTGCSFLILGIYFWRLMASQLPPRGAIVSTFVPIGPPSMAAYVFVNLSVALARYITIGGFVFHQSSQPLATEVAKTAVAETIIWIGVLIALFLLGFATFFLVEAIAAVVTVIPKTFNIGLWSFVFPFGVYANAFCRLSMLLRDEGMKGWAATCAVITVLLWLMCALLTTYKAVFHGKLFFAPGLQGWIEQQELTKLSNQKGQTPEETLDVVQSTDSSVSRMGATRRHPRNDGSYETGIVNDRGADSV